MDKPQAKRLVSWALAAFPHMQDREMGPTVELWTMMLNDIPYELGEKALKKVLATAKFFPAIAEIRDAALQIAQLTSGENPLMAIEAWGEYRAAARRYGYYRQPELMDALSPLTQKTVRYMDLSKMLMSTEPEMVQARFMKAYEQLAAREREYDIVPEGVLPDNVRQNGSGIVKQIGNGHGNS